MSLPITDISTSEANRQTFCVSQSFTSKTRVWPAFSKVEARFHDLKEARLELLDIVYRSMDIYTLTCFAIYGLSIHRYVRFHKPRDTVISHY